MSKYIAGTYKTQCDRCGQIYKRYECQKEWTGLLVCNKCYEPRHPVTKPLPIPQDGRGVRDARPKSPAVYVSAPEGLSKWGVSYVGSQGLDSNLTWNNWNETWGGNNDPDDFILGS